MASLCTPAFSQRDGSYVITASIFAAGGSTARTGTDYALSATIGQPLAGPASSMAGGQYEASTGFWPVQEAAPAPPCAGDCSSDGRVAVNELITLVNIALGNADASVCALGIPADIRVNISFIVRAVNNALIGCPP